MPRDVPDQPGPDQPGPDQPGPGSQWFPGWEGAQWNPGWEKWGLFPSFFGADRATAGAASSSAGLLDKVVSLLRSRLLDRRLTAQTPQGEVTLTLTELDIPVDSATLSVGQLDDITATAKDICWRDLRFQQVEATLRNPSLRSGKPTELVAAPVDLRLTLAEEQLADLLAKVRPELLLEVTPEAVIILRWRQHPQWGHLEVSGGADGTRIWVRAHALVRGGRRLGVSHRVPPVAFRLPLPADRVTIEALEPGPRSIDLVVRVDQVRVPVPSGGLDELVRRLGKLGTLLDFSRWTF